MPNNPLYLPPSRPLAYKPVYSAEPAVLPYYGTMPPPYNPAYDARVEAQADHSDLPVIKATSTEDQPNTEALNEIDECSLAECLNYEAFRHDDPDEKAALKLGRLALYSIAVPVKLVTVVPIAAVTAVLCVIPTVIACEIPDNAGNTIASTALVSAKVLGYLAGAPLAAVCCGLGALGTSCHGDCQPSLDELGNPPAPRPQHMS